MSHTLGEWMDCGYGKLLHPVTKKPETLRVVEAKGWGRIFEVYDYSNESEANFNLILAAPDLLAALAEIVELTDRYSPSTLSFGVVNDRARAAIAKARSEQTTTPAQDLAEVQAFVDKLAAAAPALQSRLPDSKLAEFGRWVLRVLEEHEEWSADTTDEIARFAFENGLAYDDGSFRSCEMPPLKSTEEAP